MVGRLINLLDLGDLRPGVSPNLIGKSTWLTAFADGRKASVPSADFGLDAKVDTACVFSRSMMWGPGGEVKSWRSLVQHGERVWDGWDDETRSKQTTAARLFSSGTTGLPNAVDMTHHSLITQHTLAYDYKPGNYEVHPPMPARPTAPDTSLAAEPQAPLKALLSPDTVLNQVWGMSETSCIATMTHFFPEHDPSHDAKLVDDEGNDIAGDLCSVARWLPRAISTTQMRTARRSTRRGISTRGIAQAGEWAVVHCGSQEGAYQGARLPVCAGGARGRVVVAPGDQRRRCHGHTSCWLWIERRRSRGVRFPGICCAEAGREAG
ncbi:hypothetical protein P171DRAFT_496841 [Karstenula rhodostoma CBS 690.94]|uniref:AMP-dependent synthetase/ligase domain-containing protein n=1 Tax=Karstenula rhodostoma CBS 690.94 TaxID=1392251 RepID=A0A9P4PFH9_9PLEO|nr:hypothetical protein P171DRAFT_496841 [Karstenula rhodostoma CBS 690.94]